MPVVWAADAFEETPPRPRRTYDEVCKQAELDAELRVIAQKDKVDAIHKEKVASLEARHIEVPNTTTELIRARAMSCAECSQTSASLIGSTNQGRTS
jgi:hypothetical protein